MKSKKTILFLLASSWVIIVLFSFSVNYNSSKNEQARIALLTSRYVFDHILTTRLWNARHGGLYVPVTPHMQPNPYLDVLQRDIKISESLTLTQVNPSFMTRQLSEIAKEQGGIQFHMTSLNPIRPQNKPTATEERVLREFEKGALEKGSFSENGYFYMAPLEAKMECLKCHVQQGYKEGDIMGGISLELPMVAKVPAFTLILGHVGIGILGLLGIVVSVFRLNSAYERIRNQATTDALTKIPNRRYFSETITKEVARSQRECQPLSVILCDIDNFKLYNDTYGHSKGDSCLQAVAQTIKASLGRATDFCARYGGEEFVVVLPGTTCDGALTIAETIRFDVQNAEITHVQSLPAQVVTLSLGVATLTTETASYEALIKNSDMALYKAKEQGRNRVCCLDDIAEQAHASQESAGPHRVNL